MWLSDATVVLYDSESHANRHVTEDLCSVSLTSFGTVVLDDTALDVPSDLPADADPRLSDGRVGSWYV